ncbi:MAG: hypothetical protein IJA10_00420 [Lachnospiraceae bacterium]|nr:hypothetical protein [Lachnospiraceae bacterium]
MQSIEEIQFKNVDGDHFIDLSEHPKKSLLDRIHFVLCQYEEQEKYIETRLDNKGRAMYLSMILFIVAVIAEIYFYSMKSIYGPDPIGTTAFAAFSVVFWKCCFYMIENIFEFNVHNETLCFLKYKAQKGIFTIKSEQRYCKEQISYLKELCREIETTFHEDMIEQYKNVKYKERRAEEKVFTFFDDNKLICYIFIFITILMFLV